MKEWGYALILTLFISVSAEAQTFTIKRAPAGYHPTKKFNPSDLMALEHFKGTRSGQYVVVEGYIDCLGSKWPEDDGDYHFELQSTNAPRGKGVSINGLVCEIDPTLQLDNSAALKAIKRVSPATYRKARVYGYLRFGSEKSNHSGIHTYTLASGENVKGHWEIHPVEKVIWSDSGVPVHIGPDANYVKPDISERYSLTDKNFKSQSASNYGALRGTVKWIKSSADGSGDYEVGLQVNNERHTVTIPKYYVQTFDSVSKTLTFLHLAGFASIQYSLKPTDTKQRTFYGLRNWTFDTGKPVPVLQPVEMIK